LSKKPNWVSTSELRRFGLVAGAGFVAAILATAPASLSAWALARSSPLISIARAEGTVWRGKLSSVAYNGVTIGDIDYRLRVLPLLLARADFDTQISGGALLGRARLRLGPDFFALLDVDANFDLGAVRKYTFFGIRYEGAALLKADHLRLTHKGCTAIDAALSTTAVESLSSRWSGGDFPMAGALTCREGAMVAELSGEGVDGKARIVVSIGPDYAYSIRVAAEPRRQDLSRALQQFGFEKKGDALSYEAVGALKGLSS